MVPSHKHKQEESVDSWLMSYADMITLLMCFFIIFVSVSEPKKERISAMANGMSGKFGTVNLSTPFDGVIHALQGVIENHQSFREMTVAHTDKSVDIELSSTAFFKPDSAELADDKIPLLTEAMLSLKQVDFIDFKIAIEGHTSDVPPKSGLFATNWELSSARASRVVRELIEQGVSAKNISAVGYADTQPKVPNEDVNGNAIVPNREINDRIMIRLERM